MVQIVEAVSKRQMKEFAKFPIRLYEGNEYYVPSFISDDVNLMNPKKNFAFTNHIVKCFLAYKDGKVVGRVCAIINNEANAKFNEKMVCFSRIDFVDDKEVSEALINAVKEFGKEHGMEYIHGPWGFNDTDREGMLTFGFDECSTYGTAYSYPYYPEHMDALGFEKESEWQEFRLDLEHADPRFEKVATLLKRGNKYRNVCEEMSTKKVIKKYGDSFFECYNKAYSKLDNFIPIDEKSKKTVLSQFATLLNNKFFQIIVNDKEEVVAFLIGIPYIGDALRKAKGSTIKALIPILKTIKKPQKIELALIGVHPDYQNSGVHVLAIEDFGRHYKEEGIKDSFMDPILTTNLPMMSSWKGMNKTLRAKRQTYKMHL